ADVGADLHHVLLAHAGRLRYRRGRVRLPVRRPRPGLAPAAGGCRLALPERASRHAHRRGHHPSRSRAGLIMAARARLKLVFWLNVAIVLLLVGYKVYLNFFAGDYETMHPRAIREIEASLEGKERFSFAVVGNINNSIGIFERKILPMLNAAGVDFVVSAGNAVSGGGEDKYRALSGSLGHLDVPCLLTFGPREASNFGAFRYYDRFGPYFFSFTAGNSRFIFLDSTGETSFDWQLPWLEDQLRERTERHAFVFMSHPLFESGSDNWFASPEDHFAFEEVRERLVQLFSRHGVRAVFSA